MRQFVELPSGGVIDVRRISFVSNHEHTKNFVILESLTGGNSVTLYFDKNDVLFLREYLKKNLTSP